MFSAAATLPRAVDSVRRQTVTDLEILIVLNGSDHATREAARLASLADSRVRVLDLPTPNLAAALNVALRHARAGLVARMDADDECPPQRFEIQERFLQQNRNIAVVGTAYQRRLPDGTPCGVVTPPQSPREIRWRLLLGNTMCHGSTMTRREVLLSENGYNESCPKAQDFELWLRLSARHDLANLPDVLYTYTVRDRESLGMPSEAQAGVAADRLLAAWAGLPPLAATPEVRSVIEHAVAQSHLGGAQSARAVARIEEVLRTDGPTRESMMAWMFASRQAQNTNSSTAEACKRSNLREKTRGLRALDVTQIWLWGAGRHTEWLLDHPADLGLNIAGIVDDSRAGEICRGFTVASPESLDPRQHVLLSSDRFEDEMWCKSGPLRARGVHVHRLYAHEPNEATTRTTGMRKPAHERAA